MNDLISKKEILRTLPSLCIGFNCRGCPFYNDYDMKYNYCLLEQWVNSLPPANPEPKWVPVTERLPEDEYVLISKKPSPITGKQFSVTIGIRHTDPRSHKAEWRDIGFGKLRDDEVFAWQPKPEPYQEEGGEQE